MLLDNFHGKQLNGGYWDVFLRTRVTFPRPHQKSVLILRRLGKHSWQGRCHVGSSNIRESPSIVEPIYWDIYQRLQTFLVVVLPIILAQDLQQDLIVTSLKHHCNAPVIAWSLSGRAARRWHRCWASRVCSRPCLWLRLRLWHGLGKRRLGRMLLATIATSGNHAQNKHGQAQHPINTKARKEARF